MHRALTPAVLLGAALVTGPGSTAEKPTRVQELDLRLDPDVIEPSVTIRRHDNRVEEEYSVNNNVYMVKISPASGPPYYLVDPDGDGNMEMRRSSGGMDINVPQWSLFSW